MCAFLCNALTVLAKNSDTHAHTHTHTHTHIHTHTNIHTHTHARTHRRRHNRRHIHTLALVVGLLKQEEGFIGVTVVSDVVGVGKRRGFRAAPESLEWRA